MIVGLKHRDGVFKFTFEMMVSMEAKDLYFVKEAFKDAVVTSVVNRLSVLNFNELHATLGFTPHAELFQRREKRQLP